MWTVYFVKAGIAALAAFGFYKVGAWFGGRDELHRWEDAIEETARTWADDWKIKRRATVPVTWTYKCMGARAALLELHERYMGTYRHEVNVSRMQEAQRLRDSEMFV